MQFLLRDIQEEILCLTVYDRDYFAPNGKFQKNFICYYLYINLACFAGCLFVCLFVRRLSVIQYPKCNSHIPCREGLWIEKMRNFARKKMSICLKMSQLRLLNPQKIESELRATI